MSKGRGAKDVSIKNRRGARCTSSLSEMSGLRDVRQMASSCFQMMMMMMPVPLFLSSLAVTHG